MFNGAHSAANRLATFGSNIDLPQGQVHIGTSGSNEPNLFLTSDGVALRQGTTSILTVTTTTTTVCVQSVPHCGDRHKEGVK